MIERSYSDSLTQCHPELAGVGIEYSWGKTKMIFRSQFNNGKATELMENVQAFIGCHLIGYGARAEDLAII